MLNEHCGYETIHRPLGNVTLWPLEERGGEGGCIRMGMAVGDVSAPVGMVERTVSFTGAAPLSKCLRLNQVCGGPEGMRLSP